MEHTTVTMTFLDNQKNSFRMIDKILRLCCLHSESYGANKVIYILREFQWHMPDDLLDEDDVDTCG